MVRGEEYRSRELSCDRRVVDDENLTAVVDIPESELMAGEGSEVEFFGIRIKVKDPRLAALLNSDVTDDVVVIAKRAKGVFDDDADRLAEFDSAGEAEPADK